MLALMVQRDKMHNQRKILNWLTSGRTVKQHQLHNLSKLVEVVQLIKLPSIKLHKLTELVRVVKKLIKVALVYIFSHALKRSSFQFIFQPFIVLNTNYNKTLQNRLQKSFSKGIRDQRRFGTQGQCSHNLQSDHHLRQSAVSLDSLGPSSLFQWF